MHIIGNADRLARQFFLQPNLIDDQVVASAEGLHRKHLRQKPCNKKLNADYDSDQSNVERGLIGDIAFDWNFRNEQRVQFVPKKLQCKKKTNKKRYRTQCTKKMHRFLSEPAYKCDRQ